MSRAKFAGISHAPLRSAVLAAALCMCAQSADAQSVSYGFDTIGRLICAFYSDGTRITYSYDGAGNRTQQVTGAASCPVPLTAQPPVAVTDTYSTPENTPANVTPLSNDISPLNYGLSITSVSAPSHGTASVPDSSHVLYTPSTGTFGPDSFTYSISDGHNGTSTGVIAFSVIPGSAGPVANNYSLVTTKGVSVTTNPLAHSSDPYGEPLTITSVSTTPRATLNINGGATITYSPIATYTGPDSFTYTIADVHGGMATATVSVTVNPPLPTAVPDSVVTFQNASVWLDPTANDTDPNGAVLNVTSLGATAHGGAAVINNGQKVTYTPPSNYTGPDSFSYTVSDPFGSASSTISVTVKPGSNHPPVANADSILINKTIAPGQSYQPSKAFDPRSNDTDADSDVLTITAVTNGARGTVQNNGTSVAYLYNTTVSNALMDTDTFTYTIDDGHGATSTATVTVHINVQTTQ